jgi:hypothetical protein
MSATVDVILTGPIFRANGAQAAGRLLDDLTWEVAGRAESTVSQMLDESIRNPTPYYETQITRERIVPDAVVHDRGVIYGPWLEGESSRNQATRFKGYHSFRRATQQVEREVESVVGPVVDRWVRSMS